MITETLIRQMEDKTAAYRKDYVRRLGPGLSREYLDARLQGFYDGSYGTEEIHQKMMQDQLRINERKKVLKSRRWAVVRKLTYLKGGKKK